MLFPITIGSIVWFANILLTQFDELLNVRLTPELSVVGILILLGATVILGLFFFALQFVKDYLKDDPYRHIHAISSLVFSCGLFFAVLCLTFFNVSIEPLITTIAPLKTYASWVFAILIGLGMSVTIHSIVGKATSWIVEWIKNEAPTTYYGRSWNFQSLRFRKYYVLLAKIFWVGVCLTYGIIVVSVILIVGLSVMAALHAVIVSFMAIRIFTWTRSTT